MATCVKYSLVWIPWAGVQARGLSLCSRFLVFISSCGRTCLWGSDLLSWRHSKCRDTLLEWAALRTPRANNQKVHFDSKLEHSCRIKNQVSLKILDFGLVIASFKPNNKTVMTCVYCVWARRHLQRPDLSLLCHNQGTLATIVSIEIL